MIGTANILLGILLIALGIVGWKMKKIRVFQGWIPREVNTDKYLKYMGILSIAIGLFYLGLGVLSIWYEIPIDLFIIGLCGYVLLWICGEHKHKWRGE
jgi:uncharacterized iron-regulated membrane protein